MKQVIFDSGDLAFQLRISAPPSMVFRALTTLEGLKSWWRNPVSGDPKAGGHIRFAFEESDEHSVVQVQRAAAPSAVVWHVLEDTGYGGDWEGTQIEFELRPIGADETDLQFCHRGLTAERPSYEDCSGGWKYFLESLAAACAV